MEKQTDHMSKNHSSNHMDPKDIPREEAVIKINRILAQCIGIGPTTALTVQQILHTLNDGGYAGSPADALKEVQAIVQDDNHIH